MSNSLFDSQSIVVGSAKASTHEPIAKVTMGDSEMTFPMIDISGGSQSDRIQVDVSLDGGINVTGKVNSGVGTYVMTFLDGPLTPRNKLFGELIRTKEDGDHLITTGIPNSNIGTAAEKFLRADSLSSRAIKVQLFTSAVNCIDGVTSYKSKQVATFVGIATAVEIQLAAEESAGGGVKQIKTRITATGTWSYE